MNEAKRALKFCAVWTLFGMGHLTYLAAEGLYWLYERFMIWSDRLDEGWVWKEEWD